MTRRTRANPTLITYLTFAAAVIACALALTVVVLA